MGRDLAEKRRGGPYDVGRTFRHADLDCVLVEDHRYIVFVDAGHLHFPRGSGRYFRGYVRAPGAPWPRDLQMGNCDYFGEDVPPGGITYGPTDDWIGFDTNRDQHAGYDEPEARAALCALARAVAAWLRSVRP